MNFENIFLLYPSLCRKGYTKKITFNIHQNILVLIFSIFDLFYRGGYPKHNISIIHQMFSYISIFVNSHIILFTIFFVYSNHWHHGQVNWSFLKILSIKNIQSNTQETCIIIFSKSYIIYNYFDPNYYVLSTST